ncbi:MAG: SIS domain-containing protein [Thermoplasmata archaeon]
MPGSFVPGTVRMRALAADLPNGILSGFRSGRELALPNDAESPRVYVVGMGGSAIAAELLRGVVDTESRLGLTVLRSADLPRALDAKDRAVLVSYSGETWETLRAYEAAGRAGARRVVVTSGDRFSERAEDDGVPVLRVPPGMPSRAAVGHLLGGILGLLDLAFPESNEARIARIAERLRAEIGRYVREGGPAAEVAEAIGVRTPYICAETGFFPLARRWKSQIEENAKRLASFDEIPELFHNAIVGWNSLPRSEARRYAAVLLEWTEEEPSVRKGIRYFERLLASRGVRAVRVPLTSEDRLEAMIRGVALGDQVSLRLAERRRTDPGPVEAIDRLRTALGRTDGPGR